MFQHTKLLEKIKKATKKLIIVPNNNNSKYNEINNTPSTLEQFKQYFQVNENRYTTTVCHSIITNQKMNTIKWENKELFDYLKDNNIHIKIDKFNQMKTASVGFLVEVNPTATNKEEITNTVKQNIIKHQSNIPLYHRERSVANFSKNSLSFPQTRGSRRTFPFPHHYCNKQLTIEI